MNSREQQLEDAFAVVKILIGRQQSALAWSVAQLAAEAASQYYSLGKYQGYSKQLFELFQQEGK